MPDNPSADGLPLENVQDYSRPPALEPVPQRLRVVLGGQVIADTRAGWRVLETHHPPTYYLPPSGITPNVLVPVSGTSFCEWKGKAAYFDVQTSDVGSHRAAWCYPKPTAKFAQIKDYVAFYPERMEACFVGDVLVEQQPGSFYGGWVTPNLRGIVKGGPGTEGW